MARWAAWDTPWKWWIGAPGHPTAPVSGARRLDEYAVVKLDTATGERLVHRPDPHRHAGEAVFVPAAGAADEDDGYLLTTVSDLAADASRLLVLDAHDLSPTAEVRLPRRVPPGIHGS